MQAVHSVFTTVHRCRDQNMCKCGRRIYRSRAGADLLRRSAEAVISAHALGRCQTRLPKHGDLTDDCITESHASYIRNTDNDSVNFCFLAVLDHGIGFLRILALARIDLHMQMNTKTIPKLYYILRNIHARVTAWQGDCR